jgi:glycosyltransferase involved in cell wall biosynthesis
MRIIVIQPENIKHFPPTITLLISLSKLHNVTFISKSDNKEYLDFFKQHNIEFIFKAEKIRLRYGIFPALIEQKLINYKLWSIIKKKITKDTIVWSTTEKSIHLFGYKYLKINHVMQLMELIESKRVKDNSYFSLPLNFAKIANKAKLTIVPEYNRSHLMKLWWKLNNTPYVLPNKLILHPREPKIKISDLYIESKILEIIKSNKKIILYQGVVHEQRNLIPFIQAINQLNDKFVFVLMTELNSFSEKLLNNNLNILHIPWVNAPDHLQITSWASIGLLSYVPQKIGHLSELNALYCAPNKIYEYSGFGIPMLSNDCPSLGPIFNENKIGEIIDFNNIGSIINAINKIENSEYIYQKNCNNFFDHIDMNQEINKLVEIASNENS